MSEYFTSPEEYMEKVAAGPGWSTTLGKLVSYAGNPKVVLPVAAGGAALGTVGLLGAMSNEQAADTLSYRINRGLFGLVDRIRADEEVGTGFAKAVGKGLGESMVGLTTDIVAKGYETLKDRLGLSPTRQRIFKALKREDLDIANADNKTLMEAYHTMANIAPNLSTDKNAVKSVLRLAATSGGGLDYMTIKGIADAETAINKAKSGGLK